MSICTSVFTILAFLIEKHELLTYRHVHVFQKSKFEAKHALTCVRFTTFKRPQAAPGLMLHERNSLLNAI